jgi:Uma2 family endonuclease
VSARLVNVATSAHHKFSFDEYVELVDERSMKLEFLDGQIFAMSGGTPQHAAITAAITTLLTIALQGKPCRVYSPDLRIRSKATGLATYADVTVVCGQIELDPEDPKKHTVLNPIVLVEVLSPSTEEYDRGDKLAHYKTIPSLQEVILVASERQEIEILQRERDGTWSQHRVSGEEIAKSIALGCDLPLAEIYRDPFLSP